MVPVRGRGLQEAYDSVFKRPESFKMILFLKNQILFLKDQGSLACCSPWGCKELDTTEQLNWTDWTEGMTEIFSRLHIYSFNSFFKHLYLCTDLNLYVAKLIFFFMIFSFAFKHRKLFSLESLNKYSYMFSSKLLRAWLFTFNPPIIWNMFQIG